MTRILTVIFFITLFFCAVSYTQNALSHTPNNIQVAFPFLDNAENASTSATYWSRDTNVWQIKITNAHSGTQVWAMLPTSGTYV